MHAPQEPTVGPEQGVLCHELLGQHGPLLEVVNCETHVLQELLNSSVGGPENERTREGVQTEKGLSQYWVIGRGTGTPMLQGLQVLPTMMLGGVQKQELCVARSQCVVAAAVLSVFCTFCRCWIVIIQGLPDRRNLAHIEKLSLLCRFSACTHSRKV
jgi:hypothetical protein